MTLPPVIRIFFALDLPYAVKENLGQFITSLKKKSRTHAIRWSRPENLHITLQFLGETKVQHLPLLIENVRRETQELITHIPLAFDKVHLFPNPYRPRVIVLNAEPQETLNTLAQRIGEGIKASHYAVETRPYRAHLTLGRIKYTQGIDLHFLEECELPELEPISVTEVTMFRSEPGLHGSKYTPIERIVVCKKALAS